MREGCQNAGTEGASYVVKLCLDHRVAIMPNQNNTDNGPLLSLCANCADEIKRMEPPTGRLQPAENSDPPGEPIVDVLLPMQQVSAICDNTVLNSKFQSFVIFIVSILKLYRVAVRPRRLRPYRVSHPAALRTIISVQSVTATSATQSDTIIGEEATTSSIATCPRPGK